MVILYVHNLLYWCMCMYRFGHMLHALLSRTAFQHLSGTRTSMDFSEVNYTDYLHQPAILYALQRYTYMSYCNNITVYVYVIVYMYIRYYMCVQIPSHLFEYFARTPSVVRQWARHHKTGQGILLYTMLKNILYTY